MSANVPENAVEIEEALRPFGVELGNDRRLVFRLTRQPEDARG